MKTFLQLACSAGIARNALCIALVVGTVLNFINQGATILAGNSVDWFRLLLNYLVPYCVASHINPAINIVGLIVRHKDVPPLAEGQREPAKRQKIHTFAPALRGRRLNRSGRSI